MNLKFENIACPKCSNLMRHGNIVSGEDVILTKVCNCGFKIVILVPNQDYDYNITRNLKVKK